MIILKTKERRYRRHKHIRVKISGTNIRPRLCVFRSKKHIYAQLIDDENGKTLAAVSDLELKGKKKSSKIVQRKNQKVVRQKIRTKQIAIAFEVGKLIAKKALQKKIEKVIFDRGGYKYHGKVKVLAEGAREGGLKF